MRAGMLSRSRKLARSGTILINSEPVSDLAEEHGMTSAKPKVSQPAQAPAQISATRTWLDFASALVRKRAIKGDFLSALDQTKGQRQGRMRELWELTELSASAFADDVADFYGQRRIDLPEMMAAPSLAARFSRRFLREMSIFPFQAEDGYTLAVAEPTDLACVRAAELELRNPVSIRIASFEDIATALSERLGGEAPMPGSEDAPLPQTNDDIENLRDLASGAPVVRAVNELLEQAAETRATDIHIEPHRAGLTIRMRVDGLLRVVPMRADLLPHA